MRLLLSLRSPRSTGRFARSVPVGGSKVCPLTTQALGRCWPVHFVKQPSDSGFHPTYFPGSAGRERPRCPPRPPARRHTVGPTGRRASEPTAQGFSNADAGLGTAPRVRNVDPLRRTITGELAGTSGGFTGSATDGCSAGVVYPVELGRVRRRAMVLVLLIAGDRVTWWASSRKPSNASSKRVHSDRRTPLAAATSRHPLVAA